MRLRPRHEHWHGRVGRPAYHARQQLHDKIEAAEQQPRRTVWLVDGGITVEAWYREEDYEKAADHLLRIYKEAFVAEAKHFNGGPGSIHEFKRAMPHVEPRRVTQLEYETEWFPPLNPA